MVNKWGVRVVSVPCALGERQATAGDVLRLLGLRAGGHLPPEGMAERFIDGVRVYVAPVVKGDRRVRGHRVYAICDCGRHIPVGRLHQHRCAGSVQRAGTRLVYWSATVVYSVTSPDGRRVRRSGTHRQMRRGTFRGMQAKCGHELVLSVVWSRVVSVAPSSAVWGVL